MRLRRASEVDRCDFAFSFGRNAEFQIPYFLFEHGEATRSCLVRGNLLRAGQQGKRFLRGVTIRISDTSCGIFDSLLSIDFQDSPGPSKTACLLRGLKLEYGIWNLHFFRVNGQVGLSPKNKCRSHRFDSQFYIIVPSQNLQP